jgi:hypothetical protein
MAETIWEPILWVQNVILDTPAEQSQYEIYAGHSPWTAVIDIRVGPLDGRVVLQHGIKHDKAQHLRDNGNLRAPSISLSWQIMPNFV